MNFIARCGLLVILEIWVRRLCVMPINSLPMKRQGRPKTRNPSKRISTKLKFRVLDRRLGCFCLIPSSAQKIRMLNRVRSEKARKAKDKKSVKEDINEVEVPRTGPSLGMLLSNPIKRTENQDAEPGQFNALHGKSPARLADRKDSLQGFPAKTRADTDGAAARRAPHFHGLSSDYILTTLPDHEFDPNLDAEAEYYPLFSMYRSMALIPTGAPTQAEEVEDIDEERLLESGLDNFSLPELFYTHGKRMAKTGKATLSIQNHVRSKYGEDAFKDLMAHGVFNHLVAHPNAEVEKNYSRADIQKAANLLHRKAAKYKPLHEDRIDESVVDPSKMGTLDLWDEHARRSAAHGSGSRQAIIQRIEDHVKEKHGEEGLRKMRLHSDLAQVLHGSTPSDAPMVKALIDNMRIRAVKSVS